MFADSNFVSIRAFKLSVRWRAVLAGAGVVAAIVGGAGESAAATPAERWWPAQNIFSGTAYQADNLALGADTLGGFLLAARGQASYCAPGAGAFNTPVGVPLGELASGTPTFGPGGVASLVGLGTGYYGPNEVEITDLDGVPGHTPVFTSSSAAGGGDTFTGVFDVATAEGARGDIAVAHVLSPQQIALNVRPAGGSFAPAQGVYPPSSTNVAHLLVAVDGLGDTTVVAPSADQSSSLPDVCYEPAGGSFAPLDVPGGQYSAVVSDGVGGTAIAGYLPAGPEGPGLYLSRRNSPTQSFGAPVLLSASSQDPAPQLAYDGEGRLTIAWADGDDLNVATAQNDGPLSAPHVLSVPGSTQVSNERLAVDPAGDAVLAWLGNDPFSSVSGGPAPVYAAVRTGRMLFESPQLISSSAVYSLDGA
jgi:hypothetical protein